jgi:16S rRNA processing protein RimM
MVALDNWVKLIVLTSPHGVKGAMKTKPFSANFSDYSELIDEAGKKVSLRVIGGTAEAPIVSVAGVTSRDEAERWRGKVLGVMREQLATIADPDALYIADLIDMRVVDAQGSPIGVVKNVMNFGAGDILEITFTNSTTDMFAFTKYTFPTIDMAAKRITFHPPEILGSHAEEGDVA